MNDKRKELLGRYEIPLKSDSRFGVRLMAQLIITVEREELTFLVQQTLINRLGHTKADITTFAELDDALVKYYELIPG